MEDVMLVCAYLKNINVLTKYVDIQRVNVQIERVFARMLWSPLVLVANSVV